MRLLLDTHLLLWAAASSARLPGEARALIEDVVRHVLKAKPMPASKRQKATKKVKP